MLNTNFEHGIAGHFSEDFSTDISKRDLGIRKISAGTREVEGQTHTQDNDAYHVVLKDLNESNVHNAGYYASFSTREEAQAYIDNFTPKKANEPGLFGHYRVFNETDEHGNQVKDGGGDGEW